MTPYEFGELTEKVRHQSEEGSEFVEYVEEMMALLETCDEFDFHGTEGWMNRIGIED